MSIVLVRGHYSAFLSTIALVTQIGVKPLLLLVYTIQSCPYVTLHLYTCFFYLLSTNVYLQA